MRSFSSLNPRVLTVYFISVLLISMFLWNPIIQLISLVGGILFFACLSNVKSFLSDLGFYAGLFLLITITNPLFSHNGETPLFFMNGKPVTLEAIIYGGAMGIMIISVIIWCKCLSLIMTSDKILYIFGGLMPKLSLLLSMSLRFIPLFKRQEKKVQKAQKSTGLYSQESRTDKVKSAMATMPSMIGWSLENAVETGNAMKSKGYGLKPRTSYSMFRFGIKDGIFITATVIFTAVILVCTALGKLDFYYYPTVSSLDITGLSACAYICYGILSLMPFIIETEENLKWKYYISEI